MERPTSEIKETSGVEEVRILSPTGVCGSGFTDTAFERALVWKPDFIGCDAGSTDPGPSFLGTGTAAFPRNAVRRDLRLMLLGARRLNIPLLIGSAGTAGGAPHLAWMADILKEVAAEEGLRFRLALIDAEQDKDFVRSKLREGKITHLPNAPAFDAAVIDRSERIVGMMGAEPFMRALAAGAQVVLAGRASDTAIFAALPILRGFPEGVVWHAAKILECGAASVVNRKSPDCMFAWVRKDHFVVEAPNPDLHCTPQSIAAHSLYENADPFKLVECSGTLDLANARYKACSAKSVKVSGSAFHPAKQYTVKLEGAEKVGFQSLLIGSIRDPLIIRQIDDWLERLEKKIEDRLLQVLGPAGSVGPYSISVRVYGKNGTMGPLEPVKTIRSHELCLVFEATAETQETASAIGYVIRHQALHLPIPEWSGLITALACPYNVLERGAVYRFNINHVLETDDDREMFPMRMYRIDGSTWKRMTT